MDLQVAYICIAVNRKRTAKWRLTAGVFFAKFAPDILLTRIFHGLRSFVKYPLWPQHDTAEVSARRRKLVSMANEHVNVGMKTSRIEALSDGIFAVAMTILIIGFEILISTGSAIPGGG